MSATLTDEAPVYGPFFGVMGASAAIIFSCKYFSKMSFFIRELFLREFLFKLTFKTNSKKIWFSSVKSTFDPLKSANCQFLKPENTFSNIGTICHMITNCCCLSEIKPLDIFVAVTDFFTLLILLISWI